MMGKCSFVLRLALLVAIASIAALQRAPAKSSESVDWRTQLKKARAEIAKNPSSARWHNQAGVALDALGDFKGAEKELKLASKLNPANPTDDYVLYAIYKRKGSLVQQRRTLLKALEKDPANPLGHFELGFVLGKERKWEVSLLEYCRAKSFVAEMTNDHEYLDPHGENLIEETTSSGVLVARYSQTENIDEPLAILRGGATNYYEADGLGSVTSLTNSSGAAAQTYTYDSFGKLTASTGSLTNPFQYAARDSDTESGLQYYRARYSDPTVGRFVSEDPIRQMGGVNFYAYAANNPISFVDPFGLRIDYGGYVLSNPLVRSNFDLLDLLIVQSGIDDDCFVLRVTGGDRYRDATNPRIIRSATNHAVVPNADPHSPHLRDRGARAVAFVIENNGKQCKCAPVTNALIDQLLIQTDFSAVNTRRGYPNGPHTHINLPNLPQYYAEQK